MTIALQLMAGFVLLVVGGEVLVRGASRLAASMGMTPLVIGLTVVAFGTSSPEFAVSIQSALAGSSELAVGNAVGSNTLNLLLILGMSALVVPLTVKLQVVRLDVPVMIVATVVLLIVARDGNISRVEGICFLGSLIFYIGFLIQLARRETREEQMQEAPDPESGENQAVSAGHSAQGILVQIGLILGGLLILGVGCRFFVNGSVELARLLKVSELVIGLTIVSVGTSLPELVTTLIAGVRGHRDMAVGSIIGSNLFNILGVLGLTSIIAPSGLVVPDQAIFFDIPVTLAAAAICFPIVFTGGEISRWEGGLMLFLYGCYLTWLLLESNAVASLDTFRNLMWYVVIPLTSLLILGSTYLSLRKK